MANQATRILSQVGRTLRRSTAMEGHPFGDWADMPERFVGLILFVPGVRATLLKAQTGQRNLLDDPTWVPDIASSYLLVDCALGRSLRMPMYPQLMAATAMLEKLQKYFSSLRGPNWSADFGKGRM